MEEKQFIQNVRKEINHLRKNATDEEKSRLNFDDFDYASKFGCIYGRLTGRCDSIRAVELYSKQLSSYSLRNPIKQKNAGNTFTWLESYLYHSTANTHKHIIKYIKGEIKELRKLTIEKGLRKNYISMDLLLFFLYVFSFM